MPKRSDLFKYRDSRVEFKIKSLGKKHSSHRFIQDIVRTLIDVHKPSGCSAWIVTESDYPKKHLAQLKHVHNTVQNISKKENKLHRLLLKSLDHLIEKQTELASMMSELSQSKVTTAKAHEALDTIIDRPMIL